MTLVTLTTDFGSADGYVGAMKGVIAELASDVALVDISHDIPRHDVLAGAFALAQAAPHFPAGTVHLAVVDPGVGGAREAVVVDDGRHLFVGPDNGLFSLVAPDPRAVYRIEAPSFRRAQISRTFHGRDVFAVAAGRLAAGAHARDAGPAVELAGTLQSIAHAPRPEVHGRWATVVHIDVFGNLITDARALELPEGASFRVGAVSIDALGSTFESVERGQFVAYIGSGNTLEIAIREGNAAEVLGLERGAGVLVLARTRS